MSESRKALVAWTSAMVVLAAAMYILILYTALPLTEQPYFWVSLIAIVGPLITFVAYLIRKWGEIRKEWPAHKEFSYKGGPICGFLGAINMILVGFSSSPSRSPAEFQAVASQLTIPAVVIFSAIFIRRYPNRLQMLCAALVMGGVVVSSIPSFRPPFIGVPFWMVCFVIGNAVQGPAATIMEHSMKSKLDRKVVADGFMASTIVGVWTAVFFFLALPLNFWPWFSTANEKEFWVLMHGAWTCTFHGYDPANPAESANCKNLWLVICLLILVVALWNAVIAEMEAHHSANYTQIANCIGGALAAFYYNIKPLAQDVYQPFSWYTVLAVLLMLAGTIGYKFFEKESHDEGERGKYNEIDRKETRLDFLLISHTEYSIN